MIHHAGFQMPGQPVRAEGRHHQKRPGVRTAAGGGHADRHKCPVLAGLRHHGADSEFAGRQQVVQPLAMIRGQPGRGAGGGAHHCPRCRCQYSEKAIRRQAIAQGRQTVRASGRAALDFGKLGGQGAGLAGGIKDAGHIGIRQFRLAQDELAELLMPLGIQVDLRIDLRGEDWQQAHQDQQYQPCGQFHGIRSRFTVRARKYICNANLTAAKIMLQKPRPPEP